MFGNKTFRIKRRKTKRVRNKYEDNMEISLYPPAAFYLFSIYPFHLLPPIPPLSLSQDTPFVVSLHRQVI
jgi:hypothetical protein